MKKKKKKYLVYMTGGWRWRLCGNFRAHFYRLQSTSSTSWDNSCKSKLCISFYFTLKSNFNKSKKEKKMIREEKFKRGSRWWMCVTLHLERIAMVGMSEEDTDVCWPLVHHLPQCFLQSFFFSFFCRRSVEMAFSKLHQNEPTFSSFSLFNRLSTSSL